MDTKCSKRLIGRVMHIAVILTILLSVSRVVYAAPPSPFIGHWQAVDVDGSDIRLTIAGPPSGPYKITWTESYISFCDGEAGIVRGVGWLHEVNPYILEADLHLECFTTGNSTDFHMTWRYHPTTNKLSSRIESGFWSGHVIIWSRPGGLPEPFPTLDLRVNYGHDWVESFYEAGHTAWVTVTDNERNVRGTTELITEPKWYWDGETGFQSIDSVWFDGEGNQLEYPPDIQPNDWVYGWIDNGASAQVRIGEIFGKINLVDDSISGTIMASWITESVIVECLDWGSGEEPPHEGMDTGPILTDGSDPYSCSWAGIWDIQPGQDVGVAYHSPDGHWVANAFFVPMPTFVAYLPYAIEGYDWPMGDEISLTINDVPYPSAYSEQRPDFPEGMTRVLFDVGQYGVTLQTNDHIVMTDESIDVSKEVLVTNLAVTDFDLSTGQVFGTYTYVPESEDYLWVWLYDRDGQVPTMKPDGTWIATFDELPPGALGGATQWDGDGDGTSIDFPVPE